MNRLRTLVLVFLFACTSLALPALPASAQTGCSLSVSLYASQQGHYFQSLATVSCGLSSSGTVYAAVPGWAYGSDWLSRGEGIESAVATYYCYPGQVYYVRATGSFGGLSKATNYAYIYC